MLDEPAVFFKLYALNYLWELYKWTQLFDFVPQDFVVDIDDIVLFYLIYICDTLFIGIILCIFRHEW